MDVYEIDPTTDERWGTFLRNHSQASIFHTGRWLEAIRKTYGYAPVAFTTSPPGDELTTGIPFCKVNGFFGRRRLVSLPFSDHCTPLVESQDQLIHLLAHLRDKVDQEQWSCLKIRANDAAFADSPSCDERFVLHKIDLRPSLDELFQRLHPSCIQRRIRRAQREGILYREGRSDSLLQTFYSLLIKTRRKHGLPPQPFEWFRNLVAYLGDNITFCAAYNQQTPVASIVILHYKGTMTYKYGCSDPDFAALGGMQFLLWHAIVKAKKLGLSSLDLGRTDSGNVGLTIFKDRWSAVRTPLFYFEYPLRKASNKLERLQSKAMKAVCSHVPDGVLVAAGKALYRYSG